MNRINLVISCVFGYLCLVLSIFISLEVILRKFFFMSLQGADELGGYVLAITSCLAFIVALIGRNHIRIDLLHTHLPQRVQAVLNWLAIVSLSLFGVLLAWSAYGILRDTVSYHSTAPTPWATPLVYPQSLWFAGLAFFALLTVYYAARATLLLVTNRTDQLCTEFQPRATKHELQEELEDAARR